MSQLSPQEIIDEIKDLIAAGNVQDAVKRWLDFTRDYKPDEEGEAIQMSSKLHRFERDRIGGKLSYENADLKITNLASDLLYLLDQAREGIEEQSPSEKEEHLAGNPKQLKSLIAENEALVQQLRQQDSRGELVLVAKDLQKQYPNSSFTFQMQELELRLGEITGLVGENATGKTTFLRILAGELARDSGTLEYPLFQKGKRLNWPHIKHQIAYVPQELPVWNESLRDGLRFNAALHGIKASMIDKEFDYILQRLGIPSYIDKRWRELSGGYKLRFALAKALIWHPQLLILDEPLANLDIKTKAIVLNDLKNISKGLKNPIAIILSSQELHGVESIADQMLYMSEGKLEHLGRMEDFGKVRKENLFEISCELGYQDLQVILKGFSYTKIIPSGAGYIISCPIEVEASQLLSHLQAKAISIQYFRDLSRSIKKRFYETNF